jgi:hypothetical protein
LLCPSPANTNPPAVANNPPLPPMPYHRWRHTTFPVLYSIALR